VGLQRRLLEWHAHAELVVRAMRDYPSQDTPSLLPRNYVGRFTAKRAPWLDAARMSLLAALGPAVVAMGWRRRGSRRSMLHLLQPSTVPLDILLTAVFIAATPLSHPPGLYVFRRQQLGLDLPLPI